jgi:hypothetical protein
MSVQPGSSQSNGPAVPIGLEVVNAYDLYMKDLPRQTGF